MTVTNLGVERLRHSLTDLERIVAMIEEERAAMYPKARPAYLRVVHSTERPRTRRPGAFVKMPLRCVK